jgi:hypothetical protein
MKKKKLKKIAKYIHEIVSTPKKEMATEHIEYITYDLEVSNKTKRLILDLIEYPDTVNLNFSNDSITLSVGDITQIKKPTKNQLYNDDNYLEIRIEKDKGFTINFSYRKRTNYEDKEIYSELIDVIKKRVTEINRQNFIDIWDKVMIESGIARDNNLEELLK